MMYLDISVCVCVCGYLEYVRSYRVLIRCRCLYASFKLTFPLCFAPKASPLLQVWSSSPLFFSLPFSFFIRVRSQRTTARVLNRRHSFSLFLLALPWLDFRFAATRCVFIRFEIYYFFIFWPSSLPNIFRGLRNTRFLELKLVKDKYTSPILDLLET